MYVTVYLWFYYKQLRVMPGRAEHQWNLLGGNNVRALSCC